MGFAWPGGLDIAPERLWTDCEPVGEDWRPLLLPERYFTEDELDAALLREAMAGDDGTRYSMEEMMEAAAAAD